MALVSLGGLIRWPAPPVRYAASLHALTSHLLDSTADRLAVVFEAPKTGDLSRMEYNVGGGSNLVAIKAGWQDVSLTTGAPDDTYDQYAELTGYSAGWQVPGYFGSTGAGSGSKRAVTQGDLVAFVLTPTGVSPNITITAQDNNAGINDAGWFPVTLFNSAGAYGVIADAITCALFYDGDSSPTPFDPSYAHFPINNITTIPSSTSGNELIGMKFTLPFKCRAWGAWFTCDNDADAIVRLFDSDAITDLVNSGSGKTFDKDLPNGLTSLAAFNVRFPGGITLNAGTAYRLAIENISATVNTLLYGTVNSAALLDAWPGGQACHLTTSALPKASLVNDASWTQDLALRPFMGLVIDQLDDGAGGGGGGGAQMLQIGGAQRMGV